PVRDVRRIRYASEGFHTWSVEEVKQFIKRHPVGTKAYLALCLLLFLGVRRGDVVKLGPSQITNGVLSMVPRKTRYRRLEPSHKPVLPILAEAIEAGPCGTKAFLETEFGKPFTHGGFGNWFADRCVEAKVPGRAHGLRKAGATIAAENGATSA